MPATKQDALKFVNTHCSPSKLAKYRNFAVTDFLQYYKTSITNHISATDIQKSWALYLKWYSRQDSGGGAAYPTPIKFWYTEGVGVDSAPTVVAELAEGAKEATLMGYGQCNYFADITFNLLKIRAVGSMEGRGPLVEKISTPGHNWVIVNRDAAKEDWVLVDLWLHAMGIPLNQCVCLVEDAVTTFHALTITVVETWDTNAR